MKNELYRTQTPHLKALICADNNLDIYDAVSKCTRCGYCIERCPTYAIWKNEILSPRGRNITARGLIEGRFKNITQSLPAIDSCLLCNACTDTCYGSVPTSEIVLEIRRESRAKTENIILDLIIKLRKNKKIFDITVKFLYILYRLHLPKIADKLKLFEIIGFPSLSQLSKDIFSPPLKFLHEEIGKYFLPCVEKTKWVYFLTCGTDYIFPDVGKSTLKVLNKIYGNGVFMDNFCCGMIHYNYGNLELAREEALKNIEKYFELKRIYGDFIIVADCSSCCAFLKKYPQLFYSTPHYEKAVEFSSKVRDIIEVIEPVHINNSLSVKLKEKKVTIHHSCKAYNDEKLKDNQEKVLKPLLGKNLIDMSEVMCCGGAGAYAFTQTDYSTKILERKIKNISQTHADFTLVSSTSCLMQIGYGTRNFYPSTTVIHYVQFIEMIII